ncbi:MAG: MOSC N-terminal beta barrel domain-containing protein [Saprospiraceae bacterium]
MPTLEKLFIYPIKSVGSIELKKSTISEEGLHWDRKWMLVDVDGKFITQRECPKLNLLQIQELEEEFLIINNEQNFLLIPKQIYFSTEMISIEVEIWGSKFHAEVWNPLASEWFSDYLDRRVLLVNIIPHSRKKNTPFYPREFHVQFSDGYPVHLVNMQSVLQIQEWCKRDIHLLQFRPNILIDNLEAFEEDKLKSFTIGDQKFDIIKPCERCIITTLAPGEFRFGLEPLFSLNKYRRSGNKVLFGMYAIPVPNESGKYETVGLNQDLKLEFN